MWFDFDFDFVHVPLCGNAKNAGWAQLTNVKLHFTSPLMIAYIPNNDCCKINVLSQSFGMFKFHAHPKQRRSINSEHETISFLLDFIHPSKKQVYRAYPTKTKFTEHAYASAYIFPLMARVYNTQYDSFNMFLVLFDACISFRHTGKLACCAMETKFLCDFELDFNLIRNWKIVC